MSGRLCCCNQQQHSKLLAQFVFRVSAFRFNTRTKTPAPLTDCRINNALIQLVPSCQDTRTQFVDVLDPPFSDTACSIILRLVTGNFYAENRIVCSRWLSHGRCHQQVNKYARCAAISRVFFDVQWPWPLTLSTENWHSTYSCPGEHL